MKEMNLQKITGVLATAAMIASGSALAVDRPDWTYVQASYGIGDSTSTGGNEDTSQWGIGGSLGFLNMWHVQAAWFDGENEGADADGYSILLGLHPNVGDATDLFFDVFFGTTDQDDAPQASVTDELDKWGLNIGVRHMVTERLELNGKVFYSDVDTPGNTGSSSADDVGVEIGGQFNFGAFSSGISANVTDDTIIKLNVRWSFDWL